MYAKFIDEKSIQPFTGRVLITKGRTYVNPTAGTLITQGYLPVIEGIKVEQTEGTTVEFRYSLLNGEIIEDEYLSIIEEYTEI